ncbi:hypothetical protein OIU76_027379 [Salix suchowensis]|nr:hypothetical protein OIU76_027379 [Salix suchowensis]
MLFVYWMSSFQPPSNPCSSLSLFVSPFQAFPFPRAVSAKTNLRFLCTFIIKKKGW